MATKLRSKRKGGKAPFGKTPLLIICALLAAALPAAAVTLTVTNANDSGPGSLRQAISDADAAAGADTILFDTTFFSTPRTIVLTTGVLPINGDLTISGPGAAKLTVSGNMTSRVFAIDFGPTVTLSGMTVTNGNGLTGIFPGFGGGIINRGRLTITNLVVTANTTTSGPTGGGGGGVFNGASGTLSVVNSTISNNKAPDPAGTAFIINGGGIYNTGGALTISDSIVSGNTALGYGGGIYTKNNATVTISRTTISDNESTYYGAGGGIYVETGTMTITHSAVTGNRGFKVGSAVNGGGGINNFGTLFATNVTISGNLTDRGGNGAGIRNYKEMTLTNTTVVNNVIQVSSASGQGGGVWTNTSTDPTIVTRLRNTIVANNTADGGPDVFGPVASQGFNLIENTSGATISGDTASNITGLDPNLGALADNGGPTQTHALLSGSPAINAGSNALAVDGAGVPLTSDQRAGAFQRVVNGTVDIGAFEVQPPPNTQPGNNVMTSSAAGDASVTFPAITRAGLTRFIAIAPATAGTPPPGYVVQTTLPAYEIDTTAGFTPPLLVSLTVPTSVSEAQFNRLRILHREEGALVDRTIRAPEAPVANFATRTIYARVNSLSPFVLALAPAQLQNIATRLRVQTGDNILIGGFIVTGTVPKKVILRGIGPSLTQFGVMGALANPTMELRDGAGTLLASNDDWMMDQEIEIRDSLLPPSREEESAIVRTLAPGNYTAILRSATNTPGIGLVEVYDLEPNSASQLGNISTRGFVQTGDDVMIGGFIVGPTASGSTRVLVKALGPDLANFGLSGVLPDPVLEIHNASGLVASNDNWRSTQEMEIRDSDLAPREDLEAAVILTLPAGNYTAIVRGKGNSTGVGLVEVYTLQ